MGILSSGAGVYQYQVGSSLPPLMVKVFIGNLSGQVSWRQVQTDGKTRSKSNTEKAGSSLGNWNVVIGFWEKVKFQQDQK